MSTNHSLYSYLESTVAGSYTIAQRRAVFFKFVEVFGSSEYTQEHKAKVCRLTNTHAHTKALHLSTLCIYILLCFIASLRLNGRNIRNLNFHTTFCGLCENCFTRLFLEDSSGKTAKFVNVFTCKPFRLHIYTYIQ